MWQSMPDADSAIAKQWRSRAASEREALHPRNISTVTKQSRKSKHRKLWEIVHPQNLGLVRSPFGNAETLIRNRNTHCEKVCHTRKSLIGHFLWNANNFLRFCIFRKSFSWEGPQLEGGGGEGRPFRCEEGGEGLWWESWNWRDINESEPIVKKVRGSGSRMRISADIYSIQTALFSECSKAEPRWDDHLTTHIIKCYQITSFWLLGMSDCHISSLIMIRLWNTFMQGHNLFLKRAGLQQRVKKRNEDISSIVDKCHWFDDHQVSSFQPA